MWLVVGQGRHEGGEHCGAGARADGPVHPPAAEPVRAEPRAVRASLWYPARQRPAVRDRPPMRRPAVGAYLKVIAAEPEVAAQAVAGKRKQN